MNKELVVDKFSEWLLSHHNEEMSILELAKRLGIEREVRFKTKFYDFGLTGIRVSKDSLYNSNWVGWTHIQTGTIKKEQSELINSHSYFYKDTGAMTFEKNCYCGLRLFYFSKDRTISSSIRAGTLAYSKYGTSDRLISCDFTPDEAIAYLEVRDIIK